MSKFFKLVAGEHGEHVLTVEAKDGEKKVYTNGEPFARNFGGLAQGRAYIQLNGVQYEYRKKEHSDFDEFKAIAEQHNEARKADKASESESKATNKATARASAVKVITNTVALEELKAIIDHPECNKLTMLKSAFEEMRKDVETLEKRVNEAKAWSADDWSAKFAEAMRLDDEATKERERVREAAQRFEAMVKTFVACGLPEELARKQASEAIATAQAKAAELKADSADSEKAE